MNYSFSLFHPDSQLVTGLYCNGGIHATSIPALTTTDTSCCGVVSTLHAQNVGLCQWDVAQTSCRMVGVVLQQHQKGKALHRCAVAHAVVSLPGELGADIWRFIPF